MGLFIVIVDYGMGNLNSVKKKLVRLKCNPVISSQPSLIAKADKLILPGVGHFGHAMLNLSKLNLIEVLNENVLAKRVPVLGICLGMQLFASFGEEGNCHGLGWIDGKVVKFNIQNKSIFKIPHMGWNTINIAKQSKLMDGLNNYNEFYFVHSYHFIPDKKEDILNTTEYEYSFCSAVEKDNIYGVQYHPEKSHDTGEKVLKNFISL